DAAANSGITWGPTSNNQRTWYNSGHITNAIGTSATSGLGTPSQFYAVVNAGTGNSGQALIFNLGTASLASNGTLTLTGASAVPAPAAVWLSGSGLLGLAGIGRRRKAA